MDRVTSLRHFVIELADRFPDLEDDAVIQACVDFTGDLLAFAYRTTLISLYTDHITF